MEGLWEYDSYRTDSVIITNTDIIEYDLKSAGTSIAREFNLIPDWRLKQIETLPKKDRVIQLGLYKRDHREYSDLEKAGFMQARKMFFEANELDKDRIIAIKKDAIFVNGRCKNTKLTENLNFRPKNEYTSWLYIQPLEVYYRNFKSPLDVKGINETAYLEQHDDFFGSFIKWVFRLLEISDKKEAIKYIRDMYDRYKSLNLDCEFYREFNPLSRYRYKDGLTYDICTDINELDISHNAVIILKICQMLL
jgi:hypothetical protein